MMKEIQYVGFSSPLAEPVNTLENNLRFSLSTETVAGTTYEL